MNIPTTAQDNFKFKEEEEFNVVMKMYFQTCVLQKFEQLFSCACGYLRHVINAQPSIYNTSSIHVSFFSVYSKQVSLLLICTNALHLPTR